jgi:hypothetical protein
MGLCSGRGSNVGHACILVQLMMESGSVSQMSQDKMIPVIAFGGPVMRSLVIDLVYYLLV